MKQFTIKYGGRPIFTTFAKETEEHIAQKTVLISYVSTVRMHNIKFLMLEILQNTIINFITGSCIVFFFVFFRLCMNVKRDNCTTAYKCNKTCCDGWTIDSDGRCDKRKFSNISSIVISYLIFVSSC